MSWKIPAAAKVSVCRHSLDCSQACLRAQLLWAIPPRLALSRGLIGLEQRFQAGSSGGVHAAVLGFGWFNLPILQRSKLRLRGT